MQEFKIILQVSLIAILRFSAYPKGTKPMDLCELQLWQYCIMNCCTYCKTSTIGIIVLEQIQKILSWNILSFTLKS